MIMDKKALWILAIVFLVPLVSGVVVDVENTNYKISCWPETATLRPVGVGFEQFCEFENKKATPVTIDYAMLFDDPLLSGRVHSFEQGSYVKEELFYCASEDYGVEDATHVYCVINGTPQIIFTGTERYFDTDGFGAIVYYNLSVPYTYLVDRTGFFEHTTIGQDERNAYYVEDLTWDPGESKKVRFRYVPSNPVRGAKWDALFGDFSAGDIFLRLDPLTNPYLYESLFLTDEGSGSYNITLTEDIVFCSGAFDTTSLTHYYNFDADATDAYGSSDGTVNGATHSMARSKLGTGSYNFSGLGHNISWAGTSEQTEGAISFWINFDDGFSTSNTNYFVVTVQGIVGANPGDGSLGFDPTNGKMYFDTEGTGSLYTDAASWNNDTWYFVVATWNTTNRTVYVNGLQNSSDAISDTFFNTNNPFLVRGWTGNEGQNVWVDELSYYDGYLSSSRVTQLYNSGAGTQYGASGENSCYYNSSLFNVSWITASYEIITNGEPANFTLHCGATQTTNALSSTNNTGTNVCSPSGSNVSMYYDLDLSKNASVASVKMDGAQFNNCSPGDSDLVLELKLYDENNPTTKLIGDIRMDASYWIDPDFKTEFSQEFLNNSDFYFCFNGANNTKSDIYLNYETPNGFTHRYYLNNKTLTEFSNLSLYNFNGTGNASDLKLTIRQKSNFQTFPGVYTKLQRRYPGEALWRTVQMDVSGDFGLVFFNILEQSTDYRLLYYDYSNNLLKQTLSLKFICTAGLCEYEEQLSPFTGSSTTDYYVVNWPYDNSSEAINFSWSSVLGDNHNIQFLVEKETFSGVLTLCNVTQTASSGSYDCGISGHRGNIFASFYSDGFLIKKEIVDLKPVTRIGSIIGEEEGGFWTFGIVLVVVAMGLFSPVLAVLFTVLALIGVFVLGFFTPLTVTFIIISFALTVVIGVKVRT